MLYWADMLQFVENLSTVVFWYRSSRNTAEAGEKMRWPEKGGEEHYKGEGDDEHWRCKRIIYHYSTL